MKLHHLSHGGIMVNYRCNASCRHCLYACSPARHAGFMTAEKIQEICGLLKKGRIGSVHIGGGEPFLDFQGLLTVIQILHKTGVQLDYVETNAFWAHDGSCTERLETLMNEGVRALCISIDPFHAEYVPWGFPLDLARSCERTGMGYFLWKQEFARQLSGLDRLKRHSRAEMEASISKDYVNKTASRYGIRLNGRAVNIDEEYGCKQPADNLLDNSPCGELLSTGHFHVDMDGFFIPPGCTGLRIPLAEMLTGTQPGKYPLYEALNTGGIAALYNLAVRYGFAADKQGYTSKCNLCFRIRKFLAGSGGFAELDEDFYTEAVKHY